MRFNITWKNDTTVVLNITAEQKELDTYKQKVLEKLKSSVKLPGFRGGKVPLELVEKSVDQTMLQNEFLDEAMSALYTAAARGEKLRPVAQPKVSLKKFVPFTALEFETESKVIGKIKLADYKKVKIAKKSTKVDAKKVDEVIENLRTRSAQKNDVDRAAKTTDQVWIDFEGFDKNGEPIEKADGKDYPLVLGSNTFIPGFESELVGKKVGDKHEFMTTFPKDYGVKTLQNQKVKFKVTVNKVQEVVKPDVDDVFAASLGPFKTVMQLKDDILKQLQLDQDDADRREHEAAVVKEITNKSKLSVPEELIDEQVQMLISEVRQNAIYRGQTYDELLKAEGKTEEQYIAEVLKPEALDRIKAGLVLNEIAMAEKITVEKAELDQKLDALRAQYKDPKMLEELNKIENQSEIANRILTEKTIKFLTN